MDLFKEKRNSLEQFVKEQVIGPGAYNKKYFFLSNWEDSQYNGQDLLNMPALHDTDEIIPETPAYQYSSAILFPLTVQKVEKESNIVNNEASENLNENEDNNTNVGADDDNFKEDVSDSVVHKQQNFPNSFGISFVFNKERNLNEDLKITLNFRKYNLIKSENAIKKKIALQFFEHKDEIKDIIDKYFSDFFEVETRKNNYFVLPKISFTKDQLNEIDYSLINEYLEKEFLPILQKTYNLELLKEVDNGKRGDLKERRKHFGTKENNKTFYYISDKKYNHNDVYTILIDTINENLQEELNTDITSYSKIKALIKAVEIYQQIKQITTDLKTLVKDSNSSPIWQSKQHQETINLPEIKGDRIQREKKIKVNNEDEKSLEYYVQYFIPDRTDNKVYVKIIIENNNEYKLKSNEPPQLNKKDKANKISFFGVELKIQETKKNCLLQYNPPQLLDFDEEDNFNKLIYRRYVDYGEGYNTSVNWGESENSLRYICSDFLPSQETPSVDFKPSKIEDGEIKDRIDNEEVLSMRFLSTLSKKGNSEIIEGLNSFVDSYGNEWLKDKKNELENESLLNKNSKELLTNQLKACENDYIRLKRNVNLLESTPKAIAAFRTMNSAMFMQLHHSIKTDKGKKHFEPENNTQQFYEQLIILDKDGKPSEYKWRSFQLAFILLNIDAFVKPDDNDQTVKDVFGTGWPERNEIADLVWFPTGGGKTEAYLGIIAFCICFRRFTKAEKGYGTTVLMRYTLRMLTLQQFQRATLLICALEAIRKESSFVLPKACDLGSERITIGLFVGGDSLPNYWNTGDKSMVQELSKISRAVSENANISTNIPFTNCPWCGGDLFKDENLTNISPNHKNGKYGLNDQLNIACNSKGCTFHSNRSSNDKSLPLRLFDEDIYKSPPTLLFGTVDKFASLANNVSDNSDERNKDTQRFFGKGYKIDNLPPELIIQDELHLLLGPLGSSVGLFEKSIDYLCTYTDDNGQKIKPKIVTSTATTRNTDKQIFALFNRRSEIFPKQGISCDDSFFAFYKRKKENVNEYESKRRYIGVLPIGKTQVWMQLRVTSIALAHRLKYLKEKLNIDEIFESPEKLENLQKVFDYYHTVLGYYNSLKDVGKTQSQLDHYLPDDVNFVLKNTVPWSFLDILVRNRKNIEESELTGRLTGEEVKTNLARIEKSWNLRNDKVVNKISSPEFVISTNMISVGIDVSRFNTMIINSMPRNIAEYIQASSRVARDEAGIVFTIHHPYRSRDISHYQKFQEFHEKFYSYVEPISVTPFANKALDRYLAMFAIVIIRHNNELSLKEKKQASNLNSDKIDKIKVIISSELETIYENAKKLDDELTTRNTGIKSTIDGIISKEELNDISTKLDVLLNKWLNRLAGTDEIPNLVYRNKQDESIDNALFINALDESYPEHWKVSHSLREIGATSVIKTVKQ